MTFSAKIKEELCKMPLKNPECVLAECCGLILFANSTKKDKIKIITEIPRGKYTIMQAIESQNKMVPNVNFMMKMK